MPQDWHGATAVIVGSGPSLAGLDLPSLLAGRDARQVTVKAAAFALPGAAACVCADWRWPSRTAPAFARLRPPLALCVDDDWHGPLPEGATLLRRWPDDPARPVLSPDPAALAFGATSGFAALNYAVLRGAARIVLLGFDYGHTADGRHHADPASHPWYQMAQARHWPGWREPFRRAAPELAARGIRVVTAGPASHLDAFPRMELDLALPRH